MILADLNQIDWAGMGSPDLPRWMSELLSEDKRIEANAFENLIVHLSSFECAECLMGCSEEDRLKIMGRETVFRLIPFLIELLRDTKISEDHKLSILVLMEYLLRWEHCEACLTSETVVRIFQPYIKRLHHAIAEGISIYKQFADRDTTISDEAKIILEYIER
jgi:hypothetical protein